MILDGSLRGSLPSFSLPIYFVCGLGLYFLVHILRQLPLFRRSAEPPIIFHWLPYIGSAIQYGIDPVDFLEKSREKHGDLFTFTLFGRRITAYLGLDGNDFVLNGRHADLSIEEIYGPLTIPVFGRDVIYDCPNSKLMEQKRFVKFGLTQRALENHVGLIEKEVEQYVSQSKEWQGEQGVVDICAAMAEITLFTAARSLQGREVRGKLTAEFASLYHDLDMGFSPINFLFPWLPLPRNRRRDIAHAKMHEVYRTIIQDRRRRLDSKPAPSSDHKPTTTTTTDQGEQEHDMISNLMSCVYKNGTPLPDSEIANMMIAILMGGQHSSSSAGSWIMLRLAAHPDIAEELYQEQLDNLSSSLDDTTTTTTNNKSSNTNSHKTKPPLLPLQYSDLDKLPLLHNVVKETLRLHGSIHTILRKNKNPTLAVPGTQYVLGTDKVLLASPMVTALSNEFFNEAKSWNPHRWDQPHHSNSSNSKNNNTKPSSFLSSIDESSHVDSTGDSADRKTDEIPRSSTRSPYIPFGAGRHRCIGEKFAYLNLGVIVATIVREFELSMPDGSVGVVPKTDNASMFTRPVGGSMVRWRRRAGTGRE